MPSLVMEPPSWRRRTKAKDAVSPEIQRRVSMNNVILYLIFPFYYLSRGPHLFSVHQSGDPY